MVANMQSNHSQRMQYFETKNSDACRTLPAGPGKGAHQGAHLRRLNLLSSCGAAVASSDTDCLFFNQLSIRSYNPAG
jgi:hypothetical protein